MGNIIFGDRLASNNSAACLFFSISSLNLYSIGVSGGLSPPQGKNRGENIWKRD